jgi:hypothetical protein
MKIAIDKRELRISRKCEQRTVVIIKGNEREEYGGWECKGKGNTRDSMP